MRQCKTYIYKGFVINRDAGPDAPWRAWREDGISLRADTLEGIKQFVTHYIRTYDK